MNEIKPKEINETIEALRLCNTYQRKDDALANCAIAAEHLEECLLLIEKLTKERDAAVRDINYTYPCYACRHYCCNGGECAGDYDCRDFLDDSFEDQTNEFRFEWRGPCKDNSEVDEGEEK